MAGSRIKGITIEIGGDTTKLQTALKGVNSEIKNTQNQCQSQLKRDNPSDFLRANPRRKITMAKQVTNNDTQQVLIPVIVDMESIRENGPIAGMKQYKITKSKVCNRMVDVILVPGTKEQYDAIMADYSREFKAEDRDKRCVVPGKDGKLIRCPECNKCSECSYYYTRENYGTATFSDLATEGDDGELMEFDPAAPDNYDSNDRCMRMLADFISFASERDPEFKTIIELLVDEKSRRQVAEQMGLPKSTVIDRVSKLRRLWDEFADNLAY